MPQSGEPADHKSTVFLDTNIILQVLHGSLSRIFEDDARSRFTYAINSVVFQELLLSTAKQGSRSRFDELVRSVEILPINVERTRDMLDKLKKLRNRVVHSNDLLIAANASECDYFVTDDIDLRAQFTTDKPKVLSSNDFQKVLEEH